MQWYGTALDTGYKISIKEIANMISTAKKTSATRFRRMLLLFLLLAVISVSGCTSVPLDIHTPTPSEKYEVLGEGTGSAVGIMLFNLIPIKQNTRFVRAYDAAVQSKGGDRLINPTIQENWFWAYVLNGYITTVKGTVVKDIK